MIFITLLISWMLNISVHAQEFKIPSELRSVMNKKMAKHGPNCWGTALYLKGNSARPRFVSSAEITYWQESSLCRALDVGDQIRPGDILNVYGPEYIFESDMSLSEDEKFINIFEPDRYKPATQKFYSGFHRFLHSETFVNSSQVIGKESPNKDDAFKLTKLSEVYGRPRGSSECQESPILTPHLRQYLNTPQDIRNSKCGYFTKVYRCQNFESYFKFSKKDETFMNEVKIHQKRIFEAVVSNSRKLTILERKVILEFAHTHLEEIKLQISSVTNEDSRMLLSWKFFSTLSLIEGIKWIETV